MSERIKTGHPWILYNGTVGKGDIIWFDKGEFTNSPLSHLAYDLGLDIDYSIVETVSSEEIFLALGNIKMVFPMNHFIKVVTPFLNSFSDIAV